MRWWVIRAINNLKDLLSGVDMTLRYVVTDLDRIKTYAPHVGILVDPEDPVKVAPGVYLFSGYSLKDKRQRRYRGIVLGDVINIELWR